MDYGTERIPVGASGGDIFICEEGQTIDDAPEDAKLIFDSNIVNQKPSEVVNSMDGNEIDKAGSVDAVKKYINGTTLYNGSSNGNVTLTDNVNNYKKLTIDGYRSLGDNRIPFHSEITYPYDDLKIGLVACVYNSATVPMTSGVFTITVSGNQITKVNQMTYNIGNDNTISVTNSNATSMYITKVIGFKEVS